MKPLILLFLFVCCINESVHAKSDWTINLRSRIDKIQKNYKGKLGLFVHDLSNGKQYSVRGHENWYYASAIKLFVLVEVFRQIELGKFSEQDLVVIQKENYRDGAGKTNWQPPGSKVTIQFLMEQMMIESDNAATDLLIDKVGVTSINQTLAQILPNSKIGPITSLLNVRRLAYSELHAKAFFLSPLHFFTLKKAKTGNEKMKAFLGLTLLEPKDLRAATVDEAFENYYRQNYNSGPLQAYAKLLEKLALGQVINEKRSREILALMSRCQTGKKRIGAGFPKSYSWAHKTGTQMNRICDMGIVQIKKGLVITACVKDFSTLSEGEEILKAVGEALYKSGAL